MSPEEKERLTLALACCIRRARNGPIYPILRDHVSKEDPMNEYYWHTREACHVLARQLGLFFPDVIGFYEHKTNWMHNHQVDQNSEEFWLRVVHPDIIAREVMES